MMTARKWAAVAFAVYVAAIVASNYIIVHWGIPGPGGVHKTLTLPGLHGVWPALYAPSGVWAAAVSFPARDVLQRLGGRWLGLGAVLVGASVAWLVSSPTVALASGVTYLCSEGLDFAVYTWLQDRRYRIAVAVSVLLALAADSVLFVLFLHLTTGFPADWGSVGGLIAGKLWVACIAVPAAWTLKNRGPVAVERTPASVAA